LTNSQPENMRAARRGEGNRTVTPFATALRC
jgi:hypothetical protein